MVDVASDPTLRACVKAARAWGVSLSVFMGAKQVTTYEYNARGDLARACTTPQWTEDDREAAFALMAYEAQFCPSGHYLPDFMPAEAEDDTEVDMIGVCHGCVAEAQAAKRWEDHKYPYALLSSTHRKQRTADEQVDLRT